jgi:rhamnosyltransferase
LILTNSRNPLVSIILRSKNEERWVTPCLEAILGQSYKNFEIILVDNHSTDKTVEKAKLYPIKVCSIDAYTPGKSLNIGINISQGELIVCLSIHCIPTNSSWLGHLVKSVLEDQDTAGVYGRQEPMSFTSDADKRDLLTIFGLDKKIQYKDSFFHNANSILKKDLWKRFPFDELTTNIEDRLWAREVLKAGYKIVYEPLASVYHYHGIHQDQNKERCSNVVKILETINKADGYQNKILAGKDINCVALIPIRGDILSLGGKTLLEQTISQAKAAQSIKQVIVTTDCPKLADIARACGAEVPFLRDPSMSKDYVDLEQVYKYSIEKMEELGLFADVVVALEVTFPFRHPKLIDDLVEKLLSSGAESVMPVKKEFGSCWKKGNDSLQRIDDGFTPRQYKDPIYISIKGLGCATLPIFLREGRLLGDKVNLIEINDPFASIEVRDQEGVLFAESVYQQFKSKTSL